jgi:hypothetical protein
MEAARTSETLVNFYQTTRRYNPEDSHLHTHRRENLKSDYFYVFTFGIIQILNWIGITYSEQLGCGMDSWASIAGRDIDFVFATASRPVMGPTHPPLQWV